MTKKQIHKLFAAGASVRAVMLDADVRQREVAELSGVPQPRVAMILAGGTGATPQGRDTARRVYAAVAQLLGIPVTRIPGAATLNDKENG
ncbi:MAG: helix-turn-helix domain-containing protein [Planctomycetota bacterium]|jgi:hypothetical protein